jgi:hypothetical protein
MCDIVSRSDEEGLGGIIFWLDALCRVVLLEVEQATCKKSRLSWAVCMQVDQFLPISYIIIAAGPPAGWQQRFITLTHWQLVLQLESETGK